MYRQFQRQLWQVYREQRAVWIAVLLLLFLLDLVVIVLEIVRADTFAQILTCGPALFILTGMAMSIAGEREQSTLERFTRLAPSTSAFLLARIVWCVLGAALILFVNVALLSIVAPVWKGIYESSTITDSIFRDCVNGYSASPRLLAIQLISWCEALAWGLIASAYSSQVLRAIIKAGVALTILVIAAWGVVDSVGLAFPQVADESLPGYWYALRAVMAVVATVAAWLVATTALSRPENQHSALQSRARWFRLPSGTIPHRVPMVVFWQELRTKRSLFLLIIGSIAVSQCMFLFKSSVTSENAQMFSVVICMLLVSAAIGIATPYADSEKNRYRVFEFQGIRMSSLFGWRLAFTFMVWSGYAVLWLIQTHWNGVPDFFAMTVGAEGGEGFTVLRPEGQGLVILMLAGFAALVAGVVVGIFVRSTIFLGFGMIAASLIGGAFAFLWLTTLGTNALWFIVIVLLVIATIGCIVCVDRLMSSRRAFWQTALMGASFCVLPLVAVAFQYVSWTTAIPPLPDVEQKLVGLDGRFLLPGGMDERNQLEQSIYDSFSESDRLQADAVLYFEELVRTAAHEKNRSGVVQDQDLDPKDPKWFWSPSNESIVELFERMRAAASQPDGSVRKPNDIGFDEPSDSQLSSYLYLRMWRGFGPGVRASLFVGQVLPDEMIRAVDEGLVTVDDQEPTLAWMLLGYANWLRRARLHDLERGVMIKMRQQLFVWCCDESRTTEQLLSVLAKLSLLAPDLEPSDHLIRLNYDCAYDLKQIAKGDSYRQKRASDLLLDLPGVQYRKRNEIAWYYQQERNEIIDYLQVVHRSGLVDRPVSNLRYAAGVPLVDHNFSRVRYVIRTEAEQLADHRTLELRIALRIYKRQEGSWPGSLNDLVSAGLIDQVPKDPYTAHPFIFRRIPSMELSSSGEPNWVLWSPGESFRPIYGYTREYIRARLSGRTVDFAWQVDTVDEPRIYGMRPPVPPSLELIENEAFLLGNFWGVSFPGKRVQYRWIGN